MDPDNEFQTTFDVYWTFTDGYFYNADLDPFDFQEAFGLVDIRVGIGPDDRSWELALLGRGGVKTRRPA